jgi:peptidyl-prolyl cis-trans isomerase D
MAKSCNNAILQGASVMFKLLRSRAKVMFWIIIVTFIASIFILWGLNAGGNKSGNNNNTVSSLGSINGNDITGQEWQFYFQNYIERWKQQSNGQPLTSNQYVQAGQAVWDGMLRNKLEKAEIEARGLELTDAEIKDILVNSPPPELMQQYQDEEGNIDMDRYYADLHNTEKDWSGVENYLRESVPRTRLMQAISEEAAVTDEEVLAEYNKQNSRAVAEYIGVLNSSITIEDEPTEEQLTAWLNDNSEDFSDPEKVSLEYVKFPKIISEQDEIDVKALAMETIEEIQSGELSFEEAAAIYSDGPSKEDGGDLGTFDRTRMVAPFTEAAFALQVGELSEPVKTEFGYHIIEVLEQFNDDAGELNEVHARHILFEIGVSQETMNEIYDFASNFVIDARKDGLSSIANADSIEIISPKPVRSGWDIPGFRNTAYGTRFAFWANDGDISEVYETETDYYVVHVLEHLPEGAADLEDVRAQVVRAINDDTKSKLASEKIAPAISAIQSGKTFEEVAKEFDLAYAITDTFSTTGNIKDIGYNTDFNTIAMDAEVGELVSDVTTNRGVFALSVTWKEPFDEVLFEVEKDAVKNNLLATEQQEIIEQWYEDQLENADIKDNRLEIFYPEK